MSQTIVHAGHYGAPGGGASGSADHAVAVLCEVLAGGVDVHRCAAARALGWIGRPAGVDALIAALIDEDEDVRADAAGALARVPDRRAAGPLLESLIGDPSAEVKLAALDVFARSAHDEAVPWLRRLVRGRDSEIAWDEDEFHMSGWDDWADVQIKAIQALASTDVREAVGDIVAAIDDEHGQDLTEIGFRALSRLGEPGREALAGYLDHDDERHRRRAAAMLADLDRERPEAPSGAQPADAAQPDVAAVRLRDPAQPLKVRLAAIDGLVVDGGEDAVPALASVLGDSKRQIRLAAITALVTLAAAESCWPNDAGAVLLAALRGELVPAPEPVVEPEEASDDATAGMANAVEENDRDAPAPVSPTSTLQAILDDQPEAVRAMAEPKKGVDLTRDDMERLALAVRRPRKRVVPVVPDVAPHLDVCRFAARVLGDLPHTEVAGELAGALARDDGETRLAAADSLARIGEEIKALPRAAIDALLSAMASTDRELRIAVVGALGMSGDVAIAATLNACLLDSDGFIRAEAVRGLAHLGAVGTRVEALLEDPEPGVRLAAAGAVAEAYGAAALDPLFKFAFAFEGCHRRQAARLLRDVDAAAASARFVAVLDDQTQQRIWQVAIECLEEIHKADSERE